MSDSTVKRITISQETRDLEGPKPGCDLLAWIKPKGDGDLSQINDILRQQMMAEMAVKP